MIFVSAGHHPEKPGACYQDFCEHDEAKTWASLIAHHIGSAAIVVPVGTLRRKVAFINERATPGSVAVEVHFNAAVVNGTHVGAGCETLYYPGSKQGRALAEALQYAMAPVFAPSRGVKPGWYRMDPARGPDYFLARTSCPAAIIEPEFVHRAELIAYRRESACRVLADALRPYAAPT